MTNPLESGRFVQGLILCQKYANGLSINVVEDSAISVDGMSPFSEEDLHRMQELGWNVGTRDSKTFCSFYNLEYVDS